MQVGPGEIGEMEIAVAEVGGAEVGAHEVRVGDVESLKKGGGGVDTGEGDAVGVELLEGFDAAAAASLALRGIDDLPGLVVTLLDACAGFAEPENDADEDGKAAEVLKDFEEAPVAEKVSEPLPAPVDGDEREEPAMAGAGAALGPRNGAAAGLVKDHAWF